MAAICSHLPSPMYIYTRYQCSFPLRSCLSSEWCSSVDRQDRRVISPCTPLNHDHYFHMQTQLRFRPAQGYPAAWGTVPALADVPHPVLRDQVKLPVSLIITFPQPYAPIPPTQRSFHRVCMLALAITFYCSLLPACHMLRGWLCVPAEPLVSLPSP